MASVLIDTETYKITLGIVEDFINFDFLNFLKKGYDPESEKIITWEMLIYCKCLDDKGRGFVNYYLLQLKKIIEDTINENLYLVVNEKQNENFYIISDSSKDGVGSEQNNYFITPEVQICKNPALIKISFYCKETYNYTISSYYVDNEILKQYEDLREITYISQLKNLIFSILRDTEWSEYFLDSVSDDFGFSIIHDIIKFSKHYKYGFTELSFSELSFFGIIHSILIDHYMETLHTLYDIAYKEITKTTRKGPLTQSEIKMITQKYSAIKDFREIHIDEICKVDAIRLIKHIIKTKFKDTKDLSKLTYSKI